jgi:uncharacterized protein (DUF2235 family)
MKRRRLVLCLDGTWNNAYSRKKRTDGHAVFKPSNVLKTARAIAPYDSDTDRLQIVLYHIGVGSLARYPGIPNRLLALTDKALGGGWGAGFEENVEEALEFLAHNHQAGDEVFIFGFSRGAATARALTRFLDWAGGLPLKHDSYYLPVLFHDYVLHHGNEPIATALQRINSDRSNERPARPPLESFKPVDVVFLGVWDTVMALGPRFRGHDTPTSSPSQSFHISDRPDQCVRHARQALAIDEVRYDFRPEIWQAPRSDSQTLKQRWFAGVHSNIGGGYVNDGLANLALHWLLEEAHAQGLTLDANFLGHYRGYSQDRLYRSDSVLYRCLDAVRWRVGRGRRSLVAQPESAQLTLNRSVITRIQTDPHEEKDGHPGQPAHPGLRKPYRPENVLQLLANQADLVAFLTSLGVDPPALPADVTRRLDKLRAAK